MEKSLQNPYHLEAAALALAAVIQVQIVIGRGKSQNVPF